jgi:hypothetical protein
MFWSKLIRFAVAAGHLVLAAAIAAVITGVIKYVVGLF